MNIKVTPPGKGAKLWVILPDVHFPEHSEEALALALKAVEVLKPTHTLLLGDVLDCSAFSEHSKRTIQEDEAYDFEEAEIKPCNAMLDFIQKNTKEHTYFLEGNHEARIERWAVKGGQANKSIYKLISPQHTLAKHRKNFTMVPYAVPTGAQRGFVQIVKHSSQMRTGGLVAVHGWSFARHAARLHLEKSRSQSIVFGHTHRQQVETSRDPWSGQIVKAFNPGTLSKLEPLYAVGGSPTDWSHGFALCYVGETSWTEYVCSIVNGAVVLPDGRQLRV